LLTGAPPDLLDGVPAPFASPHVPSVTQLGFCYARVFFAVFAHKGHIRNMNGRFFFDDPALDVSLRVGPGMAFDHLNTFHHYFL
jgi:hypothetical protein